MTTTSNGDPRRPTPVNDDSDQPQTSTISNWLQWPLTRNSYCNHKRLAVAVATATTSTGDQLWPIAVLCYDSNRSYWLMAVTDWQLWPAPTKNIDYSLIKLVVKSQLCHLEIEGSPRTLFCRPFDVLWDASDWYNCFENFLHQISAKKRKRKFPAKHFDPWTLEKMSRSFQWAFIRTFRICNPI